MPIVDVIPERTFDSLPQYLPWRSSVFPPSCPLLCLLPPPAHSWLWRQMQTLIHDYYWIVAPERKRKREKRDIERRYERRCERERERGERSRDEREERERGEREEREMREGDERKR